MKRLTRVPVRLALAIGITALTAACQHDAASPQFGAPTFAVSDGAHDGNPDFFFLPPLFKNPSSNPDFEPAAFNPNLRPAIEICELGPLAADGARECVGAPIKRFDPSAVSMSLADQHYQADWNTDETSLDATKFYRIRVFVGTQELGFADIDPVNTGKELKSVETGEYIGLVDGRTLPIKFRIENGALCADSDAPCAAATINLPTGGGITLITPDEEFHLDIDAGTTALFGNTPVTDVTFNLESCVGIDVDIPTFGDCLRVTTYFDATGGVGAELVLSDPALISLCVLEPGLSEEQEALVTLHQQDGTLVRALPHATPNCDRITARPTGLRGLALRGWRWMRNVAAKVVVPTPLYARSRIAVFDVGGGGQTDRFGASCSGAAASKAEGPLPQMVDCPASSAAFLGAAAVIRAPRTISDFQFALPAMMDYVNPDDASRTGAPGDVLPTGVKVTDWYGGAVQGATVTFTAPAIEGPGTVVGTAISNSDGIAQIDWTIAPGPNAVVASGRGIAAQNNYPEGTVRPFMPDIELPVAEQEPVVLRTGFVTFAATGGQADLIIESLTHSPAAPTTLDEVEFSVTVKNAGTLATGPFYVVVNTSKDGSPIETVTLVELATEGSSLAPQESRTLCCWRSTRAAGEYSQTAIADFHTDPELNNQVSESNEENNTLTDRYTVVAALTLPIACRGDAGGDLISRGFYVPGYPGTSINQATLHFAAGTAGDYTFSLTARSGTYDGPLLGTATASVTLTADDQANVATTFGFEGLAVTPGTTVTFAIAQVAGPGGSVFYSVADLEDPTCPVIQTDGTTPPLDTFRRQGVQVTIEGSLP